MHPGIKIGIVFVVLIIAAIAGMAGTGFCPPAGPWPQPPWCADKAQFSQDMGAATGGLFGTTGGYAALPATAVPGTPLSLTFRVALPEPTGPVVLRLNDKDYPMAAETSYLFTSSAIPMVSGDRIQYSYISGTSATSVQEGTADRNREVGDGLVWMTTPPVRKTGFKKGHVLMDAGGNIPAAAKAGTLWSTYDAMKEDGGEYVGYDYYWAYKNTSAPEIVDEARAGLWNAADEDSIGLMVDEAHLRGMKFFLVTELEWTVMPGEFPTNDNDAYMKYQENKWTNGQKTVQEMADRLSRNPQDAEANAYWDRWFAQFGTFMQKSARIAEKHNVEMLALGKQIDGAMIPANEKRWRTLIADVRAVYHGKLTQVLYTNEGSEYVSQIPWADDLDVITIYYYNKFSGAERSSLAELETAMDGFNRRQFDPLYQSYKKPLIFLLPFQSRDHAAQQQWFEPMATSPGVQQDLIAQADLYEAFFASTLNEPWMDGAFTWGYWIEPGFNPRYSFEKSSSVRGKPAALVLQRWFAQVSPA